MDGVHPVTYEMLSSAIAAITVVGGAWFFIDRQIKDVARDFKVALERIEREGSMQAKAALADIALLRETVHTKYVSNDALIRLEERLISELREMRRSFERRWDGRNDE